MPAIDSRRRSALSMALAGVAAASLPRLAAAKDFPDRPIKIIVPSAPGGPGDLEIRTIGPGVSKELGQALIVDNRAGAAGTIGVNAAARSAPDGYTLLQVSVTHAATESLYPGRGYVLLQNLVPVAALAVTPSLLAVNPSVPATSVQQLVALAKESPGKLAYASAGVGNIFHLTAELFMQRAGIKMLHVPYSQSGAARTALISGEVQLMFDAVSTMSPIVQSGKVRALATTGARRSAIVPDLPTIAESGYAGFEADTWTGILAPAGTPPDVLERLHQGIVHALESPDMKARFASRGSETIVESQAQFARRIQTSIDQWAGIIKATGIKVEA